ncbi:hypothetical protein B0H13DRAFT_2334765 [Mycena leptocephala]|nr:hypothetical protein B0H13DRAFT_2334765 [Mycena leptocephala]
MTSVPGVEPLAATVYSRYSPRPPITSASLTYWVWKDNADTISSTPATACILGAATTPAVPCINRADGRSVLCSAVSVSKPEDETAGLVALAMGLRIALIAIGALPAFFISFHSVNRLGHQYDTHDSRQPTNLLNDLLSACCSPPYPPRLCAPMRPNSNPPRASTPLLAPSSRLAGARSRLPQRFSLSPSSSPSVYCLLDPIGLSINPRPRALLVFARTHPRALSARQQRRVRARSPPIRFAFPLPQLAPAPSVPASFADSRSDSFLTCLVEATMMTTRPRSPSTTAAACTRASPAPVEEGIEVQNEMGMEVETEMEVKKPREVETSPPLPHAPVLRMRTGTDVLPIALTLTLGPILPVVERGYFGFSFTAPRYCMRTRAQACVMDVEAGTCACARNIDVGAGAPFLATYAPAFLVHRDLRSATHACTRDPDMTLGADVRARASVEVQGLRLMTSLRDGEAEKWLRVQPVPTTLLSSAPRPKLVMHAHSPLFPFDSHGICRSLHNVGLPCTYIRTLLRILHYGTRSTAYLSMPYRLYIPSHPRAEPPRLD